MLVRAANQRYWLWRGTWGTAHQIARALPLKHRGWLRRGHDKEVSFGITRAYLPRRPDKPLWMRVVRHGKREPLVLVTTRLVRGRHQSARLIQSYLDRWACEEGYRLTKHGVQTRRMTTLQSLVALAGLAWVLLRPIPIVLAANRTKLAGKNKKTLCFHFIQSVGLLAEAVRCCQDD
ncbi:MAG TPA: hypothetical protein ENJ98_06755, partial [Thiolapillus brandeum]|nr:hypothetical protein [Thiolapillus brandeum]